MAYVADQFDWMTRTWAQELAQAINGGTFGDYLDTECVNDPDADPPVGPAEAFEILTAETTNLVQNFMRECHQALEGVRAFRLRESGGPTALSIGSIPDGRLVAREGSSLVGATTDASDLDDFIGNSTAFFISLISDPADEIAVDTPVDVGLVNAEGSSSAVARADHVHALSVEILREAAVYEDTAWSALPTNAFADGTENIDGDPHTVVQSSLAGASWGMVNGSGFVWTIPNNLARTWTLGSLTTAPYFYRALSTVPNIDYTRPFVIDVHLTGQVYENGNDAVRVGLWEPAATPYAASTARARIIDRGNFGGTSTIRTFDGTSVATSPETFAPDCIRTIIRPSGEMSNFYGTWTGTWPTQWLTANRLDTAHSALNSFSAGARIVFVFINSADSSPTTTATIADVRYSQG